jgi:hypothetical protein
MPLSAPEQREPIHAREIHLNGFYRHDGLMDIEATLIDCRPFKFYVGSERPAVAPGEPIHLISVRMTIDQELTIRAFEVAMDATPYNYCSGVEQNYANMVGLRLGAGFLKEADKRVPGSQGCTHIRQLLSQLATVSVQTYYPLEREKWKRLPADQQPPPPMLNTCHGWQSHRPHIKEEFPDYYSPR